MILMQNHFQERIYGTAFNKKDELKEHLAKLEEAKLRDQTVWDMRWDCLPLWM